MAIVVPKGTHGAYRESLVLPAESVTRAPQGTSHAEASTLPMNGLTARLSLDLLGLQPGQTIAVTGAAGCYGGYMVQLAKADGLTVIADATDADTRNWSPRSARTLSCLVALTSPPRCAGTTRTVLTAWLTAACRTTRS